jgi:hypothetical protein
MFYITQKNWNKILGYAEEAYNTEESEIGGMSVMVEDKEGDWQLQDPVILKQEISSGNTVLEKEALAVYYTVQAKKMGKANFRFCWWHSHHTMKAFWSGTDIKAIGEFEDGDFSFALVVNLKGEYKFRVSVWKPVEAHQDVDIEILRPKRCNKAMAKEVAELCEKPASTFSWKKKSYNNGYPSIDEIGAYRQERLPFRSSTFNATSSKLSFTDIVEEVDDINNDAIDGTLDYKSYKVKIDKLNKILKDQKCIYKVTLIPENKLQELLHMWPNQMVVYKNSDEQIYDDSYYGGYVL